jgi:hypothetical protein
MVAPLVMIALYSRKRRRQIMGIFCSNVIETLICGSIYSVLRNKRYILVQPQNTKIFAKG